MFRKKLMCHINFLKCRCLLSSRFNKHQLLLVRSHPSSAEKLMFRANINFLVNINFLLIAPNSRCATNINFLKEHQLFCKNQLFATSFEFIRTYTPRNILLQHKTSMLAIMITYLTTSPGIMSCIRQYFHLNLRVFVL